MKYDIVLGPILARLNPYRSIYNNTECSKDVIAEVLLKVDSGKAIKVEAQEKDGGKCEFKTFLEGLGLQPIYFISRAAVSPLEKSKHSFVGESDTVRWSIGKFRKYLWDHSSLCCNISVYRKMLWIVV